MSALFKKSIQEIKKQRGKDEHTGKGTEKDMDMEKEAVVRLGPTEFNFDDLSSQEQEKLRQRGYVKKKIQKVKRQQVWKRGRTVKDPVRRQQDPNQRCQSSGMKAATMSSVRTKVTFSLTRPDVESSDIYKLLNKHKVFIEELKLSHPSGVLWFSDSEAASKCTLLLDNSELTSNASSSGSKVEPDTPQEPRANIFSRFS